MIPKIIHYCWFGGNPLPELAEKCIASWKKYCPDYEIIQWNEENFDVNGMTYTRQAYEVKKWAFVSDVARFRALVEQGGVYMDTDVELLKPIDPLLELGGFTGFEATGQIAAGIMGCQKGEKVFREMLRRYEEDVFLLPDGSYNLETIVTKLMNVCMDSGFSAENKQQTIDGFTVFPAEYFYPYDVSKEQTNITEKTYSIHYYDGSWLPQEDKDYLALRTRLMKHLPFQVARYLAKFVNTMRYRGLRGVAQELRK